MEATGILENMVSLAGVVERVMDRRSDAGGSRLSLFVAPVERWLSRIDPRYRQVWERHPVADQIALANYFLPHRSGKPVLAPTRARVIKWYCPFAAQNAFPSGHRYCLNVYTGCTHGCLYCYAAGYQPAGAAIKDNFEHLLAKDLHDLDGFGVPPAPVHLSNSTDPFQPLELRLPSRFGSGAAGLARRKLAASARRCRAVC